MSIFDNNLSIVLCGEAGQGVQTIENILTKALKLQGYNVFATKEYMSRIRGGSNSTEIIICSEKINAFVNRIDVLIPLDAAAIPHLKNRISENTLIIDIPFDTIVKETIYYSIVAVGAILGLLKSDINILNEVINSIFASKSEEIKSRNIEIGKKGYDFGSKIAAEKNISVNIKKNESARKDLLITGTEALSMGAVAGGCDFISSYPMTPGTGVLQFLTTNAEKFGVKVEQAEDEIAAINMAIGASYAGARAMVSTSGGGFALMVEGVSLSAMTECPVVIHLAQRPGPATGLPTRTEQGDLELALYAGHGEFPRIIFAPGSIQECFELMNSAFNLADKFQIPVFVLSDQYLVDTYYNIDKLDFSKTKIERSIIKTEADYKRYKLTDSGISPRGIPGYGSGLVAVDSDEHDEEGHITEDMQIRTLMVNKRLKKEELLIREIIEPRLYGPSTYKNLVIGWGSTLHIINDALKNSESKDTAFLHFSQIYPLHPKTSDYINKAANVIIVENNATGQFAKLIKRETGLSVNHKILQYNGMPFASDLLKERINECI